MSANLAAIGTRRQKLQKLQKSHEILSLLDERKPVGTSTSADFRTKSEKSQTTHNMKTTPKPNCGKIDRNIWMTAAAVICGCALASSAGAATITQSSTAPSGNIIASQLTDLGPGTQNGNNDFTDNGGPVGQAFTPTVSTSIAAISVLGRGTSAGSWTDAPQPFSGTEIWGILIGQIDSNGQLINTTMETATGFLGNGQVNITDYLTFALATPYDVTAGQTYGFAIAQWSSAGPGTSGGWFGLAHSAGDSYAGGYAFNVNTSTAFDSNNTGGPRYDFANPPFAAPNTLDGGYDHVFAVQAVPEPTTLALIGLGTLALVAAQRRRN
jgi:hypothetical protein